MLLKPTPVRPAWARLPMKEEPVPSMSHSEKDKEKPQITH
jgi:hypothetical protein